MIPQRIRCAAESDRDGGQEVGEDTTACGHREALVRYPQLHWHSHSWGGARGGR